MGCNSCLVVTSVCRHVSLCLELLSCECSSSSSSMAQRLILLQVATLTIVAVHIQVNSASTSSSPYVALSSPLRPCLSLPEPFLSVDRFALLCIESPTCADSFFLAIIIRPDGPPAWIANPSRPVSRNATLTLSRYNLAFSDPVSPASPRLAPPWSLSFSTSSEPPIALLLQPSGNLCVLNSSSECLWESFFHPSGNVLLPRQIMTPGTHLVSHWQSTAASPNISFSAVMEGAGLALFVNFSDTGSLPYGVFGLDSSSSTRLDDIMCQNLSGCAANLFHDGKQLILRSCIGNASKTNSLPFGLNNQTSAEFIRLDSDGSLRGYTYDYGNSVWKVIFDWFSNRSGGFCAEPNVCGPYGVCRHSSSRNRSYTTCTCPSLSGASAIDHVPSFEAVDKSDSRHGCRLAHALKCTSDLSSYYFLEVQNVNYFANDLLSSQKVLNTTKHKCIEACAQRCACKAAFFRSVSGACVLYKQMLSIMGPDDSMPLRFDVFNYMQITTSGSRKFSSSTPFSLGRWTTKKDQVDPNPVSLASLSSDTTDFGDVTKNYVCFLKLQNVSASGGATWAEAQHRRHIWMFLWGAMAVLTLLSVTSCLFCLCCKKRRRFKALGDEDFFTRSLSSKHTSLLNFTFPQLQEATGDFKSKLGLGGFGSVYRGTLPNGSDVAIKQLEGTIRCQKEFESQVFYLNSLRHPSLIRLTGLCTGGSRRFIVSEYMVNGSLDAWIFSQPIRKSGSIRTPSPATLDWTTRFGIALDVAKGLAFLHDNDLIHLYVKPQNILLDVNFSAKLSDYGLSRMMDQEEGSTIMHMRGTTGYMAPEWIQHACATDKSDVYSYGMVLMEILGGRKNVDLSTERDSWYFPTVAAKMYKEGKMLQVLDEKLMSGRAMGNTECEQARKMMQVAFWCIAESPSKRPNIASVILMLQGKQEVLEPPLPLHFGGLDVHNSVCDDDDSQQLCSHGCYSQSGSSSPTCFNISFAMESSPTAGRYGLWSGGGQPDDCSSLLNA
ncbi:hypothetical protein KP509_01G128800 [Ceratopteris richardii]|uniref:Receptor-like serine/threonine-protein kinase n=1 Tax=Ceratopteris richardii TaxID=49495 RepID=A0A8T2VL22_CERRI|nr:hypothetical protein KP509_01G128800 [Ceratopteris richardii]